MTRSRNACPLRLAERRTHLAGQAEPSELGLVPQAGLADEHGLGGVDAAQKSAQSIGAHIHVVIGAHEPLVPGENRGVRTFQGVQRA